MRICIYTNTAFPCMGGQEMVVDELARQLLGRGHEPILLCPEPPTRLKAQDSQFPYPIHRHPRFISTRWFIEWYRLALRRLYRKHRYDLIHCHNVYPNGYLAVQEKHQGGPPVVITSHGGDVRADNPRFRKPGVLEKHRFAVRHADALVSISSFTDQGFLKLGARSHQLHAIPNGVQAKLFSRRVQRPASIPHQLKPHHYFLFLGRLVPLKGVEVLLQALQIWRSAEPSTHLPHLAVAGDGSQREALKQYARERGLDEVVTYLGTVKGDAKVWLLQNARALVIPSLEREAFPMVLLESFASGCPVVASDAPGLKDLVDHGQTGWVTPRQDANALAASLHHLWTHPELLTRVVPAARLFAQQCDWGMVVDQHLAVFAGLVGQPVSRLRLAA